MSAVCAMGRSLLFFTMLATLGGRALGEPRLDDRIFTAPRQYSAEQFLAVTHWLGNSFSADNGKILVSSDQDGVLNAYAIGVEDGSMKRLSHSTAEAVRVQSYFPRDERFLYLSDRGGDELDHLYVQAPDGTAVDLTPGEGHKARFFGWAHDGKTLFLGTNQRDSRFFDLFELDAADYSRTCIYRDDHGYEFRGVSPDRRYLAFERTRTRSDTDILLYDRATHRMRTLTPHEGDVRFAFQTFGSKGKNIYYTTDEASEYAYLVRQSLIDGAREVVLKADWDVSFAIASHGGKFLIAGINKDGRTELRLLQTATMRRVALGGMPQGDITSVEVSRDETMLSFYLSTGRAAADLYVLPLPAGEPKRLTRSLSGAIEERDLVEGRIVRFRAQDGLEISGFLFRPHGASAQARVPALVWVHGGPGGQFRVGYDPFIQYLVNHGYAIYAINHRGSSGYGKAFFEADDRRHGQADLDDCVSSKQMLAKTGYIDPGRIGIIGRSYGGYMALAALSFRPGEFAVAVDLFGISNWVRTLKGMPAWWEAIREALFAEIGHPERDREYLESVSPFYHVDNITKPLLVFQGANDPRVLRAESDDFVKALKSRGMPVEYVVFEGEGHGLRRKESRLAAYRTTLAFLNRHLRQ